MTTIVNFAAPPAEQTPALRGLEILSGQACGWSVMANLIDALDRGDTERVANLVASLRAVAAGPPPRDPEDTYTTYTWEEWQAEFGSGVTASDALEGRAQ